MAGQNSLTTFDDTRDTVLDWAKARLTEVPSTHNWSDETHNWAEGWRLRGSDGDEMAPPIVIGELYSWLIDLNYAELNQGAVIEPDGTKPFNPSNDFSWTPVAGADGYIITLWEKGAKTPVKSDTLAKGAVKWKPPMLKPNHPYAWSLVAYESGSKTKKKTIFTIHFETGS